MKKFFISTLSAVALALPLGIGGLIFTAPVTATDADAQSAADHFFSTCSIWAIYRCHLDHQTYIFGNGVNFGYKSGRGYLPFGSDGADHLAYDYLKNRIDSGTLSAVGEMEDYGGTRTSELENWQNAFNRFFPDGQKPPVPTYINVHEYLMDQHRELQGFHEGNTPEERLESFQETCEQVGGLLTRRFQFDDQDWGANQCRVNTVTVDPDDVDEDTTIEIFDVSFDPTSLTPRPGDPFSDFSGPLFQVTAIARFNVDTNPNPFEDPEQMTVISDHRDRIVELQEEITAHDEYIATMLVSQNMNSSDIRTNTASIAALSSRVGTFADDIQKNTAGIALAYAFPSSGLNYNESFRLSGGAGYFQEEAAAAFGFTGRLSPNVTASGGIGLADGVSGARVEIGFGW